MKREAVVLIAIALVFMAGVKFGASYFTDVAKSENNEISTGEFDIGIGKEPSRSYNDLKIFDFSNLKPGDEKNITFYVKNRGSLDVSRLWIKLNVTDLEDGALSPAEEAVDSTPERGELSNYLILQALEVSTNGRTLKVSSVEGKSLRELNGVRIDLPEIYIKEGEVVKVTIRLRLSDNAGNECQTDKVKVDMEIGAEQ